MSDATNLVGSQTEIQWEAMIDDVWISAKGEIELRSSDACLPACYCQGILYGTYFVNTLECWATPEPESQITIRLWEKRCLAII